MIYLAGVMTICSSLKKITKHKSAVHRDRNCISYIQKALTLLQIDLLKSLFKKLDNNHIFFAFLPFLIWKTN